MPYALGIDVGTTFTAAAVWRDERVEVVALEAHRVTVPTVVAVEGDDLRFGNAAISRGIANPDAVAREFKRRLGDSVPIFISGAPYSADRLVALFARWVYDTVAAQTGEAPRTVAVTHPANWTEFQRHLLSTALEQAGVASAALIPEPQAATIDFGSVAHLEPGQLVLVYDLGGGTFDVALLRRDEEGFTSVGLPAGVERLGGIDFDEAVFEHVLGYVPAEVVEGARGDATGRLGLAQLRARCVEAKEALSSDVSVDVPVLLPGLSSTVRITRQELEDMVRPMLRQTVDLARQALDRAQVRADELSAVLLVGGSSRIPLVSELVGSALGAPVRVDAHPKLVVARGAARWAATQQPASAATAPPSRPSRPVRPVIADDDDESGPGRTRLVVAGIAALVLIAGGILAWRLTSSDDDGSATATTTAVSASESSEPPASTTPDTGTSGSTTSPPTSTNAAAGAPGQILWSVSTGAPLASVKGAAVADGTAVFGSQNGSVYRVRIDDGTIVWNEQTSTKVFSSPAVAGDAVFVGGSDGLDALALADGAVRWKAAAGAPVQSSPAVVDGTVYFGSDDTNLYAVDAASGAVKWKTSLQDKVLSSPAVALGLVFVGSFDGALYAVDAASGTIRWRVPTDQAIWSSPAVDGTNVYVGSNDGKVYAVDVMTGTVTWTFPTSETISSSPAVADGVVYIGSFDGFVYAIDAAVGGERWRFDTDNVVFSSPAVADDTVYIGSHSGSLYALRIDNGTPRWTLPVGSIVGTTPTVDGDRVFVGADDGDFYAVRR
jgi:outer membrane protein assembly factor BamB/actin-like ATPase involved in cell morphogenesis